MRGKKNPDPFADLLSFTRYNVHENWKGLCSSGKTRNNYAEQAARAQSFFDEELIEIWMRRICLANDQGKEFWASFFISWMEKTQTLFFSHSQNESALKCSMVIGPVIPAARVRTIHHRAMNAGIQNFERKDWMPAYSCGHDGRRRRGMRLHSKTVVHCL